MQGSTISCSQVPLSLPGQLQLGNGGGGAEEESVPTRAAAILGWGRTLSSSSGVSHGRRCAGLALLALMALLFPRTMAFAAVPNGVWLIDGKAAVQIFDCSGLLCGRILWLQVSRDPQGQLNRDRNNPDPALRQRRLCGLTILWDLRSVGPARWGGGWFYNPDDGKTYRVSAELKSANLIVARIYLGVPLLGETKTLLRVAHGTSDGWY